MKIFLLVLLPLLQGCGIGMLMAGSGASKAGTAQLMTAYTTYVLEMEKINIEREKSKLPPRKILNKEDWLRGREETPEEVAERKYWEEQ